MHTLKPILFLVLFCLCAQPAFAMDSRLQSAISSKTQKGKRLPELWVSGPNDESVNATRRAAKIVVLNLWATWCAPCIEELPSLATLQQHYRTADLEVVPLSVDSNFDAAARARFRRRMPDFDLPLYWDADAMAKERIGIHGVPTTLILRGDGTLLDRVEGDADWESQAILNKFDELLEKTGRAPRTTQSSATVTPTVRRAHIPAVPPSIQLTPGRTSAPIFGQ